MTGLQTENGGQPLPRWRTLWGARLDVLVFAGLLLLAVFLLRNPVLRGSWRAMLLVLGIVSLLACQLRRDWPWGRLGEEARQLLTGGIGFVLIVAAASGLGATVGSAQKQFFIDFLLPALIPWLLLNHVRDRRRWDFLMFALALAACVLVTRNFIQYVQEWRALGGISNDVHLHRNYAVNLVFGLSFALWLALTGKRTWLAATGWILALLSVMMIVATGARGAWLGAIVIVLVYVVLLRHRALALAFVVALAVATLAVFTVIPPELVLHKIYQGLDSSNRTGGTWGPAIDMIRDRPWFGYGFGDAVFHHEFNRRAPDMAQWTIKQSIGAHNFFLALGFAAGIPALILLLALQGLGIWRVARRLPAERQPSGRTGDFGISGVALIAAFSGVYLVIGNVENINWHLLAFWFGMTLVWLQLNADGK